ncbi:MAG TPA: RagB/SusD family nutrient uptake outer membrane protein [Flavisolibacter sp.]|nr:RagB/SusD family nutrient uptake outer membrane protein [Flavisolibacter sp.]
MKINKKIITFSIVSLVLLATTGCRKWIEQQPESELGVAEAYSNVDNAFKSIIGVYDELQGDPGYGIRISLYFPYDSDEGIVSGGLDNGRRGIGRYDLQLSNADLRNPFVQLYRGVEKANLAIDQLPKSDKYNNGNATEQRELRRIYGEALTLRAQYYFELIRNWGDVPAPMTPAYKTPDLFPGRTNRDSTYDRLLEDLKTAEALVPWRTEVARNERITKGAVKALRARIALFRGGFSLRQNGQMQRGSDHLKYYQIARDETAALMERRDQHNLNPSFENLWRNVNSFVYDPVGEIIFEVGAGGGNSNSDSRQGQYNGVSTNSASRYGGGGGGVFTLPTYFYEFDSTDSRRDVTVGVYQVNADNRKAHRNLTQITDGKYRRDWRVPLLPSGLNLGYNWSLIRFSDVLLMFAEAENELNGPTAAARAAFEEVRTRAYRGNRNLIGITPTDKAGFFQAIMRERLLEFGGEAIRKYDLIRWNKLEEKIGSPAQGGPEGEVRTKLRQLAAATGPYANVPRYIFWRNSPTNPEEMEVLNSYYKPTTLTSVTGWNRVNWREDVARTNNLYNVGTTNVHYIDAIAYFFKSGKSELFPFDQGTMAAYQGKLQQNPGY